MFRSCATVPHQVPVLEQPARLYRTRCQTGPLNKPRFAFFHAAAIADTGAVSLGKTASVTLKLNASETIGSLAGGGTTGCNDSNADHRRTFRWFQTWRDGKTNPPLALLARNPKNPGICFDERILGPDRAAAAPFGFAAPESFQVWHV